MRNFLIIGLILVLAGCGSGRRDGDVRLPRGGGKPMAFGPINSACMASDRKARSRSLCGCIQAVANQTLSSSQQRRAVSFYDDPHKAQVIRQSDRAGDEAFWKAYRAYGDKAKQVCG